VTLLLLVVPLVWSIQDARQLTRTDTRVVAGRWIARNVPPTSSLAADPSGPPFDRASIVRFELPRPGRRPDARRDVDALRLDGIHYVIVTGAVTDRVLAARDEYPVESRFYAELARETRRAFYVEAGSDRNGPWVAVYDLRS
jgi:hypothetical protein